MKRRVLGIVRQFAVGYVAFVLLVTGCQNRLLYHPRVSPEPALLREAEALGVQPWRDGAGRLIGWREPNSAARARLLCFQGNAGAALDRRGYLQTFNALGDGKSWETFMLEYPGYGARPGPLGREAFLAAGRAAIAELRHGDQRPLYLCGESIGSGTAAALAGEFPDGIAGVLFVVPFARLVEVANDKMPWLPVRLILRDDFDNIAALAKFHGPVAFVIACNDEVVGAEQGRKLYESYAGSKLLIELPGIGHNDYGLGPDVPWVANAAAFLTR
ncbi:MAG: alpha/beta hydrolase [Chthoniobacter sp.]|nr:alpha/beta hydrolase [Chthoniobacter sp.]